MRTLAALLMVLAAPALSAGGSPDPRLEHSRELSDSLGQQLKARLLAEMQRAGPLGAIDVGHVEAPMIAGDLSGSKVTVGRTAPRVRNLANAPTAEQNAVLKRFSAELAAPGSTGLPEEFLVAADGSARYMRAIPMGGPCAACHGTNIAPSVADRIAELYPTDAATGFEPGELRGAFLISWPADKEPGS